jgi:hypothetical protein
VPLQLLVILSKLLDFKELILANTSKDLPGIASRPPDFQLDNPRRFSQSDMLSQGRSSE